MNCRRLLLAPIALGLCATAAHSAELQIGSAMLLYETGQAAPVIEMRSVAEDGATWRAGVSGWTLTLAREKSVERGRRLLFAISATPYDAHSSRRIYRDGVRTRDLEFDDAAFGARAGLRIRQTEHTWLEPSVTIGKDVIGSDAPRALRDAWRAPYAGAQLIQHLRFVTAEDPFSGRINGIDVAATAEAYRGNRTWSRAMITETAGLPIKRLHIRQTLAAFGGSGLDTVSAFLVGGSWDTVGPLAVYGRRYAELRVTRGIVANAGADLSLTDALEVGIRAGTFRGPATRATGSMLLVTRRAGGIRMMVGACRSAHRTTVAASVGGALFR